jgi:heme A synthase
MARVNWALGACLFGPATLLGQQLIDKTHHRPLGAATFASLVVLMWLLFEGLTRVSIFRRDKSKETTRRAERWLLVLGVGTSAVVLLPLVV